MLNWWTQTALQTWKQELELPKHSRCCMWNEIQQFIRRIFLLPGFLLDSTGELQYLLFPLSPND
jgi:hypothetical protein